jgi:chromosome segregation ATPase
MPGKKPPKPTQKPTDAKLAEDWFALLLDEVQAARAEIADLHAQGVQIMATLADLQAEAVTLKQTVADAVARIQAHEDAESTADAALQAQVATLTQLNTDLQTEIDALKAGGTDTAALDALLASYKDVEASVQAIDPAPPPAPETPVP